MLPNGMKRTSNLTISSIMYINVVIMRNVVQVGLEMIENMCI